MNNDSAAVVRDGIRFENVPIEKPRVRPVGGAIFFPAIRGRPRVSSRNGCGPPTRDAEERRTTGGENGRVSERFPADVGRG